MSKQIEINVPEWFVLDELHTLDTIISPNSENIGILMAGENFDLSKTCSPTVRLYLMRLIDDKYEVIKELDAFPFNSTVEAKRFSAKLPELNAIDLVMMLNKEEPVFSI
ncbi:geranylgeranyl pyrophosphate synthase [Solibacillus sp. FSL H8-0538]|uniref:geranylgeranyl pyrophosphate synthase n=1 Tax=Solibacillus sp. FSL H8-0538 TaxID=2921400 RepID=UPI0030FCFAD9